MKSRILIVDDKENWRGLIEKIVLGEGYEPRTASNYDEAIAALDVKYDVALLDLRLEDSDHQNEQGFDIAREIHRRNPNTQIIFLTGYGTEQHRLKAKFKYKAFYFLHKDNFDSDIFRTLLSESTGIRKTYPIEKGIIFDWTSLNNREWIDQIAIQFNMSGDLRTLTKDNLKS